MIIKLRKTLSVGAILATFINGMPAQAQLLERTNSNWGTNRVFSYAITTTYGTNITVDASPNVITKAEAVLNLKEDRSTTPQALLEAKQARVSSQPQQVQPQI